MNFTEYSYARYQANWRINTRLNAGFDAFWEDANDSGSVDQYLRAFAPLGRGSIARLEARQQAGHGLRYRYVKKDSDLALRSYYQNDGTLTINYDF